jgi:hypothetical protein
MVPNSPIDFDVEVYMSCNTCKIHNFNYAKAGNQNRSSAIYAG